MQQRDRVPKKNRAGFGEVPAPHLTARCPARWGRYREREFSVTKSAHSTHPGFTHGLLLGKRCPSSTAGMGEARCCLARCAQDAQDGAECLGCYRCCSSSAPAPPASAPTWRFPPLLPNGSCANGGMPSTRLSTPQNHLGCDTPLPSPQKRAASLPSLWHSWHTKLGILGCAMGHSPALRAVGSGPAPPDSLSLWLSPAGNMRPPMEMTVP